MLTETTCPHCGEHCSPAPPSLSAARKSEPVFSGNLAYFPRTHRAISRVSMKGSAKHNPGEPVRWAKEKSTDHPDCVARHNLTPYSVDEDTGELHIVHAAWRQLAWCETVLEALDKGLVSIEDLESGEVAASELGALIVEEGKK